MGGLFAEQVGAFSRWSSLQDSRRQLAFSACYDYAPRDTVLRITLVTEAVEEL